jgi:CRP-like cAMP-binding protein
MIMNFLVDLANASYLISYSVRDVLWLRIFAVIGGILLIPYYYHQPTPLMASIYWGLGFIALNMFWVVRLMLESRPVKLSEEEQLLYQLAFRTLTPREMLHLLKFAEWEDKETGEILQKEGEAQDRLSVIVSGRSVVQMQDRQVNEFGPGHFVGEFTFMTDEVALDSIVAIEPVRHVSWHKNELKKFLKDKPELMAALGLILGRDIGSLLVAAWNTTTANGTSTGTPPNK